MSAESPLKLTTGIELPASMRPVVIVGANGTGKSSIGVALAGLGAQRISARRALDVPPMIQLQPLPQAQKEREKHARQFASQRTTMASDLQMILTELHAQESEMGRQVLDELKADPALQPDRAKLVTGLDHVRRIWEAVFPKRKLTFKGSEPKVVASHRAGDAQTFAQNDMSDGERQALYLVAKVATIADGGVIVVDEPETHMHPTLARRLWDLIEDFRPTSRFVYITHDLLFALSRRPATFVACRADGNHQVVEDLPDDVAVEILGASSMPLAAERVFFCEGEAASADIGLFDIWFDAANVAVFPVGSCDAVVRSVEGLRAVPTNRAAVAGIVDRDARCAAELAHLSNLGVTVLPVAEIEHLYCLPTILSAVLTYTGVKDPAERQKRTHAFRQRLSQHHAPAQHRLVLERAQDRVRWELKFPLASVSPGATLVTASQNLATAFAAAVAAVDPAAFFMEAERTITTAVNGSIDDMLRDLPGKTVLGFVAQQVGMTPEAYTRVVREGLRGELGDPLKRELVAALEPHLPQR